MRQLVSWNVNSIRARLDIVLAWLQTHQPDVMALQETKVVDADFPRESFEQLGYQCYFSGQPAYNGVAILTKSPMRDLETNLSGYVDQQRFISGNVFDFRLVNVYVPNGAVPESDKFAYKLGWLDALHRYLADHRDERLLICGDFNIAPADIDVHDPERWVGSVLVSPEERSAWIALCDLGFSDAFRHLYPDDPGYTWWDYRGFAFRWNAGLRIDHFLVSASMRDEVQSVWVDRDARALSRPSDHAPVVLALP